MSDSPRSALPGRFAQFVLAGVLATACPRSASSQAIGSLLAEGDVPAFPGAEGFGAAATGGRGGKVIKVTTLAASGPGSLAEALATPGPRIVVFEVSGVIEAELLEIPHGDLTIAGQTAPAGGITIRGRLYADYDSSVSNIIVRHIRIRPPTYTGSEGQGFDAMQFSLSSLLIFDHISVAFGVDENVDLYEADRVTVQWSTIEESATEGHPEGEHNYGLIQGEDGYEISLHHNLFVHHKNRTPAVANGPAEIVNNVSYNCRQGFVHNNDASGHISIVGNYYRRGPSDSLFPFYFDYDTPGQDLSYYLNDNYIDDPGILSGSIDNPWKKPAAHPSFQFLEIEEDGSSAAFRADSPFVFANETASAHVGVTTHRAEQAYVLVLDHAGAFPRDVVTRRDIQEARDRTGQWGARVPANLMDGLSAGAAPTDTDADGMPDAWEADHGLDPADPADHSSVMPSGYTAIEDYINERADQLSGVPDAPDGLEPGTSDDGASDIAGGCNASRRASGFSSAMLALGLFALLGGWPRMRRSTSELFPIFRKRRRPFL